LPIAAEIDRRFAPHCETYDGVGLVAVAHATVILAPRSFTGVTDQIGTGNVMMVAEFTTTQAQEIRPYAIDASTIDAVTDLVIDRPHEEAGLQFVPSGVFIRMNIGPAGDAAADRWQSLLSVTRAASSRLPSK